MLKEEEPFVLAKGVYDMVARGLRTYAEREHELRLQNGGRRHGPLQKVTLLLGVDDILDDEWKRALALAAVCSVLAFVLALLGSLHVDNLAYEADKTGQEEEEQEVEDEYRWTPKLALEKMDGGNELFLYDLLERFKPAWLVRDFTDPTSKLADPLEAYRRLPSDHWISKHQFRFPVSLNTLLLCGFAALVPTTAKRVEFDLEFATKMLRLLDLSNAKTEQELSLVKKSLLLAQGSHYLLFWDVVLSVKVCQCWISSDNEVDWEEMAKQIANGVMASEHEPKEVLVIGQGFGGTLAIAVANLLPLAECIVFGAIPVPTVAVAGTIPNGKVTHFVHYLDQAVRESDYALDLFFKLLVKLDECEFPFPERLSVLRNHAALPDQFEATLVSEMEHVDELNSKNLLPCTSCYWFAGKGEMYQLDSLASITSQPMFAGSKQWFKHSDQQFQLHYRQLFVE
ncbi:hypothetical protein BASA81_002315 [Batrachochytrium salamandrivorans]|nr:hypothetical protein BASA81_002315 [Batrachochytrium salamandrivorans]